MADRVDLSQKPYNDDYNENKKFYRILFRPSRAVQVRELNQLQSMLQKQIERMGSHIFEQGAQVLPGSREGVKYINNNTYIKIPRTAFADDADQLTTYWLGKVIKSTSGATNIRGEVIGFREADSIDEARLYVRLLNADDSGLATNFSPGQNIETEDVVPVSATISPADTAVGFISSVIVEEGVYFFNGNFILVDQQTLFLIPDDPEDQTAWNNRPTALAGLVINESVVTSEDDPSLLDNSLGSPNFSAPGADRLAIDAVLEKRGLNDTGLDFIPLLRVIEGNVQARVVKTEYSILEDTLARRTFDESGDYALNPFIITIRDFLREEEELNDGIHVESEFYFDTEDEAKASSKSTFGQADPGVAFFHVPAGKWMPGRSYDSTGAGNEPSFKQLCRAKLSIRIDPGKAYVKGYEIEKLSSNVVDIDRARTLRFVNNKTVFTPLGTFVYATNLFGVPRFEQYKEVELHSKIVSSPGTSPNAKIGTAKLLAVEFFTGINGSLSSGIYRLFLFDIQTDEGFSVSDVVSIYGSSPTFTANLVLNTYRLTGSVESDVNLLRGTGTAWKNDENERLKAGQYVQVGLGVNASVYLITADPENDNELSVTPDPDADGHTWADGSTISLLYSEVQGFGETSNLVYKLPDETIYTIRGGEQGEVNSAIIDTVYTSRRVIADGTPPNSTSDGTGKLEFTLTDPNEEFEDFSPLDYVVINTSNGDWLEVTPFVSGSPGTGKAEVQALGSNLTIYTPHANTNFYVIASIIRSGSFASKERAKTLIRGEFVDGVYTGPSVSSQGSDVNELSLGQADILRITRVVQSPDYATPASNLEVLPAGHKDITGLYILDNGQRDYYYGIGKAILAPGAPRPTGRIRIEFDYFTHGTQGNYFSVDSYPFKGPGANMDYSEIPLYRSASGGQYDLANCIDFRPRLTEPDGNDFAFNLEVPRDNFRCDYHFYEGRVDKLYLDRTGKFLVKKGVADPDPRAPADPDTGMTIYELYVRPYTANAVDCVPKMVDNRRYTMRDIGKLEKRIKNLEFYTTLTLLEKQTSELTIQDALGNDKFKNGFMVDNFSSFQVCDLAHPDYRAAVDTMNRELRPIFYEANVELFELNELEPNESQRELLRVAKHYDKTGDLFTLPYETEVLVEQTKCSKVSNINPYAVFTYIGSVQIYPWSDEWRDTNQLEPNNVVDDAQFNAMRSAFGPDGTSISYGATIKNWTTLDINDERTGERIAIMAGHDMVKKLRKQQKEESAEKDRNKPKVPKEGNKGTKGKSTTTGPGKPAQQAEKRADRSIVGGHQGGKNKKKK